MKVLIAAREHTEVDEFKYLRNIVRKKGGTDEDIQEHTVKPLLSDTLLSSHPLLNGHLSNSQKAFPLFTVNLTSIKRSPLLNRRGHQLDSQLVNFTVFHLY